MSSIDASWLQFWEIFAMIGFILVWLGVAMEGPDAFADPNNHRWRKLATVGWFILVLGLSMEFLGEHKAKRIADRENARLTKQAADARKESGEAMKQTEQLRGTNLLLQAKVLELEAKTQPRRLTKQQRELILSRLAGLAPVPLLLPTSKVHIEYETPDSEAGAFALQIRNLFREAGFEAQFEDANFARSPGQPMFFGWRFTAPNSPVARGIVAAFKEAGHDFAIGFFNAKDDTFKIHIGAKPLE